jgi:hypothetical protein
MPQPDAREGSALSGYNFAGPGWNGPFRTRPTNAFDFASKIHDLCYCINGLSGGWMPISDPREKSRKAKADRIFRLLTSVHHGSDFFSGVLFPFSQATFLGKDESDFRRHDGFVNPLVDTGIRTRLAAPQSYLMIPYDALPARPLLPNGDHNFQAATPFDVTPGWYGWASRAYQPVWPQLLGITANRGM